MKHTAIILVSESALNLAQRIASDMNRNDKPEQRSAIIYTKNEVPGCTAIGPYATSHQEAIDAGWAATRKMVY